MSHFYLTLPSNSSSKFYNNNTVTNFKTKLHETISLNGEWEVGLSEINLPKSWYNVGVREGFYCRCDDACADIEPELRANETDKGFGKLIKVRPGYYRNINVLMDEINDTFKKRYKHKPAADEILTNKVYVWPKFHYNEIDKRVSVTLPPKFEMTITDDLAFKLGFAKEDMPLSHAAQFTRAKVIANTVSDIHAGLHTIYVYCDILESVPVGDTLAPLLRIVDVDRQDGETVHRFYEKPRYIPIQKKNFDSLEIDIRDSYGNIVPFESGTSIVTLHFKRAQESYFVK